MKILLTLEKCPHCKEIKEFISTLPEDYQHTIETVDAMKDPRGLDLAKKYQIQTVPAMFAEDSILRSVEDIKKYIKTAISQ